MSAIRRDQGSGSGTCGRSATSRRSPSGSTGGRARSSSSSGSARGERVLDVATGTGNAALIAAERGARRQRPRPDAEAARDRRRARRARPASRSTSSRGTPRRSPSRTTPSTRVISMFGAMFAPDQQRAADELAASAGPAGRIGVCGAGRRRALNGQLFMLLGPAPAAAAGGLSAAGPLGHRGPRPRSSSPQAVRRSPARAERGPVRGESVEELARPSDEQWLGPIVLAKEALEPEGRWEEARAKLAALTAAAEPGDRRIARASSPSTCCR